MENNQGMQYMNQPPMIRYLQWNAPIIFAQNGYQTLKEIHDLLNLIKKEMEIIHSLLQTL